jgi:hypothetical protein
MLQLFHRVFLPLSSGQWPLKCRQTSATLLGATSQKTVSFIFSAVRTWNLTGLFNIFDSCEWMHVQSAIGYHNHTYKFSTKHEKLQLRPNFNRLRLWNEHSSGQECKRFILEQTSSSFFTVYISYNCLRSLQNYNIFKSGPNFDSSRMFCEDEYRCREVRSFGLCPTNFKQYKSIPLETTHIRKTLTCIIMIKVWKVADVICIRDVLTQFHLRHVLQSCLCLLIFYSKLSSLNVTNKINGFKISSQYINRMTPQWRDNSVSPFWCIRWSCIRIVELASGRFNEIWCTIYPQKVWNPWE